MRPELRDRAGRQNSEPNRGLRRRILAERKSGQDSEPSSASAARVLTRALLWTAKPLGAGSHPVDARGRASGGHPPPQTLVSLLSAHRRLWKSGVTGERAGQPILVTGPVPAVTSAPSPCWGPEPPRGMCFLLQTPLRGPRRRSQE